MAAGQGDLVKVKDLVTKGADINSKDDKGVSVQYSLKLTSSLFLRSRHFAIPYGKNCFSIGILLSVYLVYNNWQ